ncbi:hypothetical protein UFOVP1454_8 [uncultured Caudovirales phage]|uniref:Uncharacterized protein n=1 Tax=uncultured Caudovirales phage TaxID=2100421 RepID=A0A6J5SHU3_9CAUD|nr:hypothetical protein UFOVP1454_8 [uncultured Caudovirales phage]
MGLKQTYTKDTTGLTVNDAYYKIDNISFKNGLDVAILVSIYSSKEDRDTGKSWFDQLHYNVSSTSVIFTVFFSETAQKQLDISLLSNAYAYIKSLPVFSTATDD